MKRSSLVAPFVMGLALCGLGCQNSGQSNTSSVGANNPSPSDSAAAGSTSQPPAAPQTHLKVGAPAPDFTLTDTNGEAVKLSDFRGKRNVVLAFYVLAFTGG